MPTNLFTSTDGTDTGGSRIVGYDAPAATAKSVEPLDLRDPAGATALAATESE